MQAGEWCGHMKKKQKSGMTEREKLQAMVQAADNANLSYGKCVMALDGKREQEIYRQYELELKRRAENLHLHRMMQREKNENRKREKNSKVKVEK